MKNFEKYLLQNRKNKEITLFFDIETYQYNELAGSEFPSDYKNEVYAVGVGYVYKKEIEVVLFNDFYDFFNTILSTYKKWKRNPRFRLIAQNNNKYDNHFLRKDLIYYYNVKTLNRWLKNAIDEANNGSYNKKNVSRETKLNGVILEKRIKSSNNLELLFYLNGIEFYTVDNFVKTNLSIDSLGKKMLQMNLIDKEELKTDFNYTKFNRSYDMTQEEAKKYSKKIFNSLTNDDKTYIKNDVIILAKSVLNYHKIFKGFSYEKITYTSNILEYYNDNDLTSYQLLKSIGKGQDKIHVKYTDYFFSGHNFYDYLKKFYGGGLNFYNDRFVGKMIEDDIVGIDINSSYPYAMHNFKVPTFLKYYEEVNNEYEISIDLESDDYYLYEIDKETFDNEIIDNIDSIVVKKMLTKYYGKHKNYVYINTNTFKILNDIFNLNIEYITCHSFVVFECYYFGSREKISAMYEVKEKGSSKKELIYKNPYDIQVTEEENKTVFNQDEIDIAKVKLNGLYGIPALRSHFNLFRLLDDGSFYNFENGYKNNERNIVFSIFVTSIALYNLLLPFKTLKADEIDNNFLYCDTDSLYYRKKIHKKIDKDLFHDHHLGKWSIDNDNITHFKVINHKKYAYAYGDNETIEIKCGGIPLESFNTNMSFKEFCKTQFFDGAEIKNKKSIFNNDNTISIYPSITELQVGKGYRIYANDKYIDDIKDKIIKEVKEQEKDLNDLLYLETNIGTFSSTDIFESKHEEDNKLSLDHLIMKEFRIKSLLI